MAKIKLTAQELKRQKDSLKRYERFLPTLILKKLQIQIELDKAKIVFERKGKEEKALLEEIEGWSAVLGEGAGIGEMVQIEAIEREKGNVAGVEIPVFKGVRFKEAAYDLYSTPLWVDRAVQELRHLLSLRAEIGTMQKQIENLQNELRITIQRVNLFEKVKVPEVHEHIRAIQVFLGDQQTAAVARGKLAKAKLLQRAAGSSPP